MGVKFIYNIISCNCMKSSLECPLCGAEIKSGNDYCTECGETLKKE